MWYYKTVKGSLFRTYIITDTGKFIKLSIDSLTKCKGYFLIKFRGMTWDLLRIMKIKDND